MLITPFDQSASVDPLECFFFSFIFLLLILTDICGSQCEMLGGLKFSAGRLPFCMISVGL